MQIIYKAPPNFKKIRAAFDLEGMQPVFAYGDKLYNPFFSRITDDLMVHERVHELQQQEYKDNSTGLKWLWNKLFVSQIDQWWNRYIVDTEFRVMSELEAYAYQYKAFCDRSKNREKRNKYMHLIALNMTSKMYGKAMTYAQAMSALRHGTEQLINRK